MTMKFLFTIAFGFLSFITINAEWSLVSINPETTMRRNTTIFRITIDQPVNRPNFTSLIHIIGNPSNFTREIDVKDTPGPANYSDRTLEFFFPGVTEWNTTDEYHITFGAGALFSNGTANSTARTDPKFWSLRVTNTSEDSTTQSPTIVISTEESSELSTVSSTALWTSSATPSRQGEKSPGRSAQIGMGIGIVLIFLIVIVEIVFFKFFYHGQTNRYYD